MIAQHLILISTPGYMYETLTLCRRREKELASCKLRKFRSVHFPEDKLWIKGAKAWPVIKMSCTLQLL